MLIAGQQDKPLVIEEAEQAVAPWYAFAYDEQLLKKQQMVHEILGEPYEPLIQAIVPSPRIVGHRNKMEFSFGYDAHGRPALGFHRRGKFWQVADLNRSAFLSETANRVYAMIKQWAFATQLPCYRQRNHQGFFRHLVLREGKQTGEILVCLVVNPIGFQEALARVRAELAAVTESEPAITSLWLASRQSVGDAAVGEEYELLRGHSTIRERILDLVFHISPTSFLQVNTFGAERLYACVRDLAATLVRRRLLIDLFCGSGGIGLTLSHLFSSVVGVDSDSESIRMARENASANHIQNAVFICAQAKQLREWTTATVDALVVDPPRAGLSPKVARQINQLAPEQLIYISCNPASFRDDMQTLRLRYEVLQITPIDLFPHTPHLELVALLQRR